MHLQHAKFYIKACLFQISYFHLLSISVRWPQKPYSPKNMGEKVLFIQYSLEGILGYLRDLVKFLPLQVILYWTVQLRVLIPMYHLLHHKVINCLPWNPAWNSVWGLICCYLVDRYNVGTNSVVYVHYLLIFRV